MAMQWLQRNQGDEYSLTIGGEARIIVLHVFACYLL